MLLDLVSFYRTFPNYGDHQIPMWSDWKEEEDKAILEIAVPGFTINDFTLYVEDGWLCLKINTKKRLLSYSILKSSSGVGSRYDLESANAEYVAGILKIEIPKVAKKKSKQIPIKVS